jgi:hypothetical protein
MKAKFSILARAIHATSAAMMQRIAEWRTNWPFAGNCIQKSILGFTLFFTSCLVNEPLAQVCNDPINVIYGMTNAGRIRPINVNTANVGAAINPAYPGNAASTSNGIGYNAQDNKFYYFKRNVGANPQEFISYSPVSDTYTMLNSSVCTNTVNSGCVSADGNGYYCIDSDGNLCYYNISTNTWTKVTSTYRLSGVDITSTLVNRPSGDMAFDGDGNLWLLCSSPTQYGLYQIKAPVPVSAVSSVAVYEKVPATTPTPTGNNVAGIAFNPTGQIFMATVGDNRLYRLENDLSATHVGNFNVTNAGYDLTSCNFPIGVLDILFKKFSAFPLDNQRVSLSLEVSESYRNHLFYIEYSKDGSSWSDIGTIGGNTNSYPFSYLHYGASKGKVFYRIRHIDPTGKIRRSKISMVNLEPDPVDIWADPSAPLIHIRNNKNNSQAKVKVFDHLNRLALEKTVSSGLNSFSLHALPSGLYFVYLQFADGAVYKEKVVIK